jgi:hypothetical protein
MAPKERSAAQAQPRNKYPDGTPNEIATKATLAVPAAARMNDPNETKQHLLIDLPWREKNEVKLVGERDEGGFMLVSLTSK